MTLDVKHAGIELSSRKWRLCLLETVLTLNEDVLSDLAGRLNHI